MARCCECGKELIDGDQHKFAGYGYFVYCEACCPREMEGVDCGKEHEEEQAKK